MEQIHIVSGNGEVVLSGWPGTYSLLVKVTKNGQPVAGETVTWATMGAFHAASNVTSTMTDANGETSITLTGDQFQVTTSWVAGTVTASIPDGAKAVFTITTAYPGPPVGNPAIAPLVQLTSPTSVDLGHHKAGSVIAGGIQTIVVAQAGPDNGKGIPNVGLRLVDGSDWMKLATGVACVGGTVLSDASGKASCDVQLATTPGAGDRAAYPDRSAAADADRRFLVRLLRGNTYFLKNQSYLIVLHRLASYRAQGLLAKGDVAGAVREAETALALCRASASRSRCWCRSRTKRGHTAEADRLYAAAAGVRTSCARTTHRAPSSATTGRGSPPAAAGTWTWRSTPAARRSSVEPAHANYRETLAEVLFQHGDKRRGGRRDQAVRRSWSRRTDYFAKQRGPDGSRRPERRRCRRSEASGLARSGGTGILVSVAMCWEVVVSLHELETAVSRLAERRADRIRAVVRRIHRRRLGPTDRRRY